MDARRKAAWREADRILDQLLDLAPERRAAALAAAAPDPAMRALVERLLAAHASATGPLERAPDLAAAGPAGAATLVGRRLGRWRLLEQIGCGGMAAVYRASSEEAPAGQLAAIKVLTLGALAAGGHERFLREQQLLARLRHPGIVPLYEGGVGEDGTPWLAMALVDGERIDAWCRRRGADLDLRIGLLLQIAGALAYAHRTLVIHRDIKPSNVLVDEHGHVRLLDFGIARLADELEPERTATALRALTPQYAAPEQFEGAAPGTAMDVYGFGALAYCMLAGQPPHGATGRDDDRPVPPPSRAAREDAGGHARWQWTRRLRGDLDTIVMTALALRPEDRYASIEAMAEDLQRWRQRRPIRARAPSLGYRLHRYVARNRWGVAASVALATALLAGAAGTLWQAERARQEALRARAAAEESQAQLIYLGGVLEALAPSTEEAREQDRHQLIAASARRARRDLAGREALLAAVELTLAQVAERAGDYAQAAELAGAALARREARFGAHSAEAAEAMVVLASVVEQTDPPDRARAQALATRALDILRRAAPRSVVLVEALTRRAVQLGDDDRHADAMTLLGQAQGICTHLHQPPACEQVLLTEGSLASRQGLHRQAEAPLQALWTLRSERYGPAEARTLFAANLLAQSHSRAGEPQRAAALLERIHAQQQRIYASPTRETLATLQNLAEALATAGQLDRALELRLRHLREGHALFGERHAELAVGYGNLGSLYFAMGRYQEAADAYLRGRDQYAQLYGPAHAGVRICEGNHADALRELGRAGEALPLQARSLAGLGELFGTDSARYATRLGNLARTEAALGRAAAALRHYDQAIALSRARSPDGHEAWVLEAYRSLALLQLERVAEARAGAARALHEIEARLGPTHRYSGEALAALVAVACASPADAGCATLRARAEQALLRPGLAGGVRHKLVATLGAAAPQALAGGD
ncbi:serine/threonine-protein kinase [Luteimonas sp. RD2P54]|uniref:Serine/threonine-protein kinase n=1 Tax=Luteimonas endophytica TaxID=3042023 RepID=A0ABT6J700_9GAMM|nr:serine/threonine-protein kinase [Luteimonas endophytica]MDH5822591.1 serine/threonine-protein kinase [Luteimonas endophytica]